MFFKGDLQTQVEEWGQCGGANYGGPTKCKEGTTCYAQNSYYSQCLKYCPHGWICQNGNQFFLTRKCDGIYEVVQALCFE